MNKWFGCGRLTAAPEVRVTDTGKKVARFRIAINDGRNQDDVDFIPIVSFDKQADFAESYLNKGIKIIVEGRLKLGSYTTRDGVKVYTTDIISERIEFAESKKAQQEEAPARAENKNENEWMPIPDDLGDDDLPWN